MAFEIFERPRRRSPREETAPAVRCGFSALTLNREVTNRLKLHDAKLVRFYFDKDRSRAAMEIAVGANSGNTYTLSYHTNGSQCSISAREFIKTVGLEDAGKIPCTWNEKHSRFEWKIPDKKAGPGR